MLTESSGSGDLVLGSAVARMLTLAGVGANDGDTFWGLIEHLEANEFELTLCTYNAASTSISRAAVPVRSTTGSKMSFSAGQKQVSNVSTANAGGSLASSTTSVSIGLGTRVFQTQAGKDFAPGSYLLFTSNAAPLVNQMNGKVTAYNGFSLTVDVEYTEGSGTYADWTIRASGPRGAGGGSGPSGASRAIDVRVATTASISNLNQIVNGATHDGITLNTGDLVLVHKNINLNGIYLTPASGSASRYTGFTTYDANCGILVNVLEGASYAGQTFLGYSPRGGTIESTPIGFERIGAIGLSHQAIVSFAQPLIYDWRNAAGDGLGGGRALYVPRKFYAERGGVVLFPSGNYGTDSTEIPGYVKLLIGAGTNIVCFAYIDFDDSTNPFKVAFYPAGLPTDRINRIQLLFVAWERGYWSPHLVEENEDLRSQIIYPRDPLVADGSFLFIPAFYYYRQDQSYQLITPADGSRYWKLPLSTTNNGAVRYFYDDKAADAGATPVVTTSGDAAPLAGGWRKPLIATSLNKVVNSEHPVVGDRRGGVGRNQFFEGKDPDHAWIYPADSNAPADITNVALTALGITRGSKATTGGFNSFYGIELPRKLVGNEFVFARCYIQADTANEFGAVGLFAYRNGGDIGPLTLTLEEKLSTTAAIYSLSGQMSSVAGADKIAIGSTGSSGKAVTVGGVQFCISQQPVPWISRQDYPTNDLPAPVLGSRFFMVRNRPLPLYMPSALRSRMDDETFVAELGSIVSGLANYPFTRSGRRIMLEGEKMGATSTLVLHPLNRDLQRRSKMTFTNYIANDSGLTATPKIHVIGDSITNRGLLTSVATKLAAWGITSPTWLGTINTSANSSTTGTGGPLGEARESRAWSDLIYSILDGEAAPLAPGSEATYLALSKTAKLAYNPYIRASTGGDSPSVIKNGYVFDFDFYLTRFGFADPDVVIIGLMRNDELESNAAQALLNVQTALPIVVPSIRAACPSARIGLWMPTIANTTAARERYDESMAMIAELNSYVRQLGDSNVHMINTHAHVSGELDWTMAASPAADAATGIQYALITDEIHGGPLNVEQHGEAIAAYIANVA